MSDDRHQQEEDQAIHFAEPQGSVALLDRLDSGSQCRSRARECAQAPGGCRNSSPYFFPISVTRGISCCCGARRRFPRKTLEARGSYGDHKPTGRIADIPISVRHPAWRKPPKTKSKERSPPCSRLPDRIADL